MAFVVARHPDARNEPLDSPPNPRPRHGPLTVGGPQGLASGMTASHGGSRRRRRLLQPEARSPARDGDVRLGGRHVADERVDLRSRAGPAHHSQRRSVRHRPRSARLRRLHPHRQQDRRPLRPQEGVRARPARLHDGRDRDDAGAGAHRDHHLLGDHRRARCLAAAALDAVADPRQLRRGGAAQGLRAGRRVGGHRGGDRPAGRRLHHDLPVVASRVRARSRRDPRGAVRHQAGEGRPLHR